MSIRNVLFLISIFVGFIGFSQDRLEGIVDTTTQKYAKNALYLELAGKGFYYSINYERNLFNIGEKTSIKGSIGFCAFPSMTPVRSSFDYTIPLSISLQQHIAKNHHISLGVGSTYFNYLINTIDISNSNINKEPIQVKLQTIQEWFGHINLDYRYNKPEGGLLLKGGITPLFFDKMQNFEGMPTMQFSANIGVGYTF